MTNAIALSGAPLLPRPDVLEPTPEVRRVAEEFESVFLAEMLAPMFEGIETDGLGGGGAGERMFRPMLVERYAQSIAQAGGVGVAESIMREMMRMQANEAAALTETPDGADR